MKINEIITEAKAVKQRLDPKCWDGYKKQGTKVKGGVRVNNCVPESAEQSVTEGETPEKEIERLKLRQNAEHGGASLKRQSETQARIRELEKQIKDKKSVSEELSLDEQFDCIEEMVESLAEEHGVDAEQIWEDFESVDDNELYETAAWRRKEGKSKTGGLNAKGVASYRRENPGSKLQTAVTTKPSKLKKGSKAAKRRKSFCARMSGVKGPMKKPNGKPTRKALALRKWNC